MKLDPKEFARFAKERAQKKDGYIMGATGQNPKKWSVSSWWFTQYSGSQRTKALYWREHAERVWDCQGLSEGWISEKLGITINVRARNNYASWCDPKGTGKIPAKYRVPGAAVFIYESSAGAVTHVGYLVEPVNANNPAGDWWISEARGVNYGVVLTKYSARPWNRWGLMTKYFDYNSADVKPLALGDRELEKGDSGADVTELQTYLMELGYDLTKYGADGDFGSETVKAVKKFQKEYELEVDGIYGENSHKALKKALDGLREDEGTEYPELKKGSEGQYVVLAQQRLIYHEYELPKYGADGDFGSETYIAVWTFQHDRGIAETGVVDAKTWEYLLADRGNGNV